MTENERAAGDASEDAYDADTAAIKAAYDAADAAADAAPRKAEAEADAAITDHDAGDEHR